jgi:hypothetical protein
VKTAQHAARRNNVLNSSTSDGPVEAESSLPRAISSAMRAFAAAFRARFVSKGRLTPDRRER